MGPGAAGPHAWALAVCTPPPHPQPTHPPHPHPHTIPNSTPPHPICLYSRWDLSVEEAVELGQRAIYHATFRDAASGGTVSGGPGQGLGNSGCPSPLEAAAGAGGPCR